MTARTRVLLAAGVAAVAVLTAVSAGALVTGTRGKDRSAQSTTVQSRMIVPASRKKSLERLITIRPIERRCGIR